MAYPQNPKTMFIKRMCALTAHYGEPWHGIAAHAVDMAKDWESIESEAVSAVVYNAADKLRTLSETDSTQAAMLLTDISTSFVPEAYNVFAEFIDEMPKHVNLRELRDCMLQNEDGKYGMVALMLFLSMYESIETRDTVTVYISLSTFVDETLHGILGYTVPISPGLHQRIQDITRALFGDAWFMLYDANVKSGKDLVAGILRLRPPFEGTCSNLQPVTRLPEFNIE